MLTPSSLSPFSPFSQFLSHIIFLSIFFSSSFSDPTTSLTNFISNITTTSSSNPFHTWNSSSSPPCSGGSSDWLGVLCFKNNVWGLRLEHMGLTGEIDIDSLSTLSYLRSLSLMGNNFTGGLPSVNKLPALKSLFLSRNGFRGAVGDDAFYGMNYLKKVYLADNMFTGRIPSSLSGLPRLMEIRLENNRFYGVIPPGFEFIHLKILNVSNNRLHGPIPTSLAKLHASSFYGNEGLCGHPLEPCSFQTNTSSIKEKNTPSLTSVAIVILSVLLPLLAFLCLFPCLCGHKHLHATRIPSYNGSSVAPPTESVDTPSTLKKMEQGRLSFVTDERERFDLHELLRASAEVLGSGIIGASYKAAVPGKNPMVVKRCKVMNNVGRGEFQEHMNRLGRISHPNILPLVAYYYRKEEKLFVFDFIHNGSLASHLHGNCQRLDWRTRVRIIKGVCRGLSYLHQELPILTLPHGHLKSSNVLLDESFIPSLSDYGMLPLMEVVDAELVMDAFKSPEFIKTGSVCRKTEVWSLGRLIMELITGRVANHVWDFDRTMGVGGFVENEVGKLARIGIMCCEEEVERRIELREAVERIEKLMEEENL